MKLVKTIIAASVGLSAVCSMGAVSAGEKLGVALPNQTNPYYVAMKKSFDAAGEKQGFDVKVLIANDDEVKQLSQIQSFIQQGVDAVALNCVSSGPCVASVAELNRVGIPVFTINLLPDPVALKDEGLVVVQAVQTDQKIGGAYVGEQLLKDIGPEGEAIIGIVGQPTAVAAIQRDDGFKEALASNPNAKFVGFVNGKVEEITSLKVTTEMILGNPEINVVFSDTEPSALGAMAAIQQLGRDDITLYAYVDKIGVQHIIENSILKAGAIQEPARLAEILVGSVRDHLDGKEVAALIDSPPLLVNKENAADAIGQAY